MKLKITVFPIVLFLVACQSFLDVGVPKNMVLSDEVWAHEESAESAVMAIYAAIANRPHFLSGKPYSLIVASGLLSDELITYNDSLIDFASNNIDAKDPILSEIYLDIYYSIFLANDAITALSDPRRAAQIPEDSKKVMIAEAKFLRAVGFFHLVNLWGDVAKPTTTDWEVNNVLPRSSAEEIYALIIEDLRDARGYLPYDYMFNNRRRYRQRANYYAATALLARVYLYKNDYENAGDLATSVIDRVEFRLEELSSVFDRNSREAIWQLEGMKDYTYQALSFRRNYHVALSTTLINAYEPGDQRKEYWVEQYNVSPDGGYTFTDSYLIASKYSNKTNLINLQYETPLRLAEQYLIRAEARARLGNLAGALKDLNTIRKRAGLGNVTANSKVEVLKAIMHERQLELSTEGHRWFDLKRSGMVHQVLGAVKPNWRATNILLPMPWLDLQINPNLTQNPGY